MLKDLPDWEMRAIIHFMYKGEINVGQEQLPLLLQAAETLQVRKHETSFGGVVRVSRKTLTVLRPENQFSDARYSVIVTASGELIFGTNSYITSPRQTAGRLG